MPIEYEKLRGAPYALEQCKHCGAGFPEFMRGQVQSTLRRFFGMRYCAVICHECKQITGWEKPND
jgi:hypothetical protein